MNARPSKFLVALARWALMAGLAGVIMGALALVDLLRSPANNESRRTLLFVSAILLSMSFVMAPLVRRAFARPTDFAGRRTRLQNTLLDEMRERSDFDSEAAEEGPVNASQRDSKASFIVRLLVATYGVFAVTLACVLWALR